METSKITVNRFPRGVQGDMKVKGYNIPDDLLYTKEHEWARHSGDTVKVGITEYAAKTLNDVVYTSLPKVGQKVKQLEVFGTVESIKAVSELYSPFSGTVADVNEALATRPELVNQSPYQDGWLIEVEPSNHEVEKRNLLDAKAYSRHLEGLIKK